MRCEKFKRKGVKCDSCGKEIDVANDEVWEVCEKCDDSLCGECFSSHKCIKELK